MTKSILLLFLISIIASNVSIAQTSSIDSLGKFDNLKTIIDPKTKQERPMTTTEVKNTVAYEVTKRLSDMGSSRFVDANKVSVIGNLVTVPILESNGSSFYTIQINRESGLSGNDLFISRQNQQRNIDNAAWEKHFSEQEKKMDETRKAIEEYRKKYPADPDKKFQVNLHKDVYKPKAPARKINIK